MTLADINSIFELIQKLDLFGSTGKEDALGRLEVVHQLRSISLTVSKR
jgi:hypothetical protein